MTRCLLVDDDAQIRALRVDHLHGFGMRWPTAPRCGWPASAATSPAGYAATLQVGIAA